MAGAWFRDVSSPRGRVIRSTEFESDSSQEILVRADIDEVLAVDICDRVRVRDHPLEPVCVANVADDRDGFAAFEGVIDLPYVRWIPIAIPFPPGENVFVAVKVIGH